jgi:hypothetical protein
MTPVSLRCESLARWENEGGAPALSAELSAFPRSRPIASNHQGEGFRPILTPLKAPNGFTAK